MLLLITKFPNKSFWSKNKERELLPSLVNNEKNMKCNVHNNQKVIEKGLHASYIHSPNTVSTWREYNAIAMPPTMDRRSLGPFQER